MRVEDGSGLCNADSYTDLAFADAYLGSRGRTAWAEASVKEREEALIRACDYLDSAYESLFRGARKTETQRLAYPRSIEGEDAQDEIPTWLKEAHCEAAWLELTEPGILREGGEGAKGIQKEREGDWERSYLPGPCRAAAFPAVYGIMRRRIKNPSLLEILRA